MRKNTWLKGEIWNHIQIVVFDVLLEGNSEISKNLFQGQTEWVTNPYLFAPHFQPSIWFEILPKVQVHIGEEGQEGLWVSYLPYKKVVLIRNSPGYKMNAQLVVTVYYSCKLLCNFNRSNKLQLHLNSLQRFIFSDFKVPALCNRLMVS